MKPCLAQTCTMTTPFAEDVAQYADGGVTAIEVWLTKLEVHLKSHSPDETRKLIADRGIALSAAAVQGGLLLSVGEQRAAHWDHFKRRLDLCERFQIPTLVVAADPVTGPFEPKSIGMAIESLAEAAKWAGGFGVRLAFEFYGVGTVCTSLETAVRIVEEIGESNLGLCLDAFHFFKGPSKESDLHLVSSRNLMHVQFCDIAGVPRELMTDSDRIFPGEGDFSLGPIVNLLQEIGYERFVSLELMNPNLWNAKPSQVAELGMTSLTRLLSPKDR